MFLLKCVLISEGVICMYRLQPEVVSLLERCPHFRGCYVQASMELGPEGVCLLEVSLLQGVDFNGVET